VITVHHLFLRCNIFHLCGDQINPFELMFNSCSIFELMFNSCSIFELQREYVGPLRLPPTTIRRTLLCVFLSQEQQATSVPVVSISREEAEAHFGFLGRLAVLDIPRSSVQTQELLGWRPVHPGLIADLEQGHYFNG
jgi:hypothetical protein